MATQNPISTVSYNTIPFLQEKLDSWLKSHLIQAYQYIFHIGEDGDKDHIHLRIEPNKRLDPMDLSDALKEYKFDNPKPLGCRPWRGSKEEDWILYAVHDPEYLALKYNGGEEGEKLPYDYTDIVVPEDYDIHIAFIRAKASMRHSTVNMASRIQQGEKPIDMVMTGENPYLVSALTRLVYTTDYNRLAEENALLRSQLNELSDAIENSGFCVVSDDEGHLHLEVIF